jgi:RluA family pseudouridine synthase
LRIENFIRLSSPATGQFWEIGVLFEDGHLLALNKPSGLLSSPDRYDCARPNLMRLLQQAIARGIAWARTRQLGYLANAHRLDYETSGIILLAKDKPTLVALAEQFSTGHPTKSYLALVHGAPSEEAFEVQAKLAHHPARPAMMRVDEKAGKKARTRFDVAERYTAYTLLRCQPLTGRTHQIRVHLRHCGLPVVGDILYGGKPLLLSSLKPGYRFKRDEPERPLMSRVALHAESLTLRHPATQAPVTICAPWPHDLAVAVKYLRRYAAFGR